MNVVGENPLNRKGKILKKEYEIVYSYRKENNYKQFIRERSKKLRFYLNIKILRAF